MGNPVTLALNMQAILERLRHCKSCHESDMTSQNASHED